MRSGELKALEWGDVDEKNGTWRNIDISSWLQRIMDGSMVMKVKCLDFFRRYR